MTVVETVVVDASLGVKWVVPEAGSAEARALRDRWRDERVRVLAPDLVLVEVANALWKKVERGLIPPESPVMRRPPEAWLSLELVRTGDLLADALGVAVSHHLTVYDAVYVALARRLRAPLYTADEALRRRVPHTLATVRGLA